MCSFRNSWRNPTPKSNWVYITIYDAPYTVPLIVSIEICVNLKKQLIFFFIETTDGTELNSQLSNVRQIYGHYCRMIYADRSVSCLKKNKFSFFFFALLLLFVCILSWSHHVIHMHIYSTLMWRPTYIIFDKRNTTETTENRLIDRAFKLKKLKKASKYIKKNWNSNTHSNA